MRLIFSSTTFATTFVACHSLAGVGSNLAAASIRDFTYYSDVEQPGLKTNSSFNEECPFGSASVTSHLRGSEVDAGILGCSDPEYVCIEDSLSSLGGRCAPPAVAHRELQKTPPCTVKCTGTDACLGVDQSKVGVGSCCGYKACSGVSASSVIGAGSCIGFKACYKAQDATIGNGSCTGDKISGYYGYYGFTCQNLKGTVGDNSCFEYAACYQKSSMGGIFIIGNNSCRGQESCEYTGNVKIGDKSCNDYYACFKSSSEIGVGSCNALQACQANTAPIGDNVCNTYRSCYKNSSPITSAPTKSPSKAPTKSPTSDPTKATSSSPTKVPTNKPTLSPMKGPTKQPLPTLVPTKSPTIKPITSSPSKHPSMNPTSGPTKAPMMRPTTFPTPSPSKKPSLPTLPGKSSKEDEKSKSAKSMNTKSSKAGTMQFQETGETSTYELPSHKSTPKSMEKEVPYWISTVQTANSDGRSTDLMTVVTWTYQEEVDMNDEFIRS